ncbi:hypothetical protein SK128_021680, partial [Halocaridina rubra]
MTIYGDPENPRLTGTLIDILEIFAERLGFCYKFMLPSEATGGLRLPNGTWTGAVHSILDGSANFTGLVLVNADRVKYLDISEYLFIDEHSAAYMRPTLDSDIEGFYKPYTYTVWILVMFSIATMATAYLLIGKFYNKFLQSSHLNQSSNTSEDDPGNAESVNETKKSFFSSVYDAGLWSLATILCQPMPWEKPGESMRLLSCMWLLISFVIGSVYRSNLMAMLILPKVTLPFDNLAELTETNIPVWTMTHSILHIAALNMPNTTSLGKLRKQLVGVDGPPDVSVAVRGLLSGELAVAVPLSGIHQTIHSTFSATGKCTSYIMSENFLKTTMASLAFPKGTHWKKKLDPIIVRLREAGIFSYIYKKFVFNATECLKPVGSFDLSRPKALDLKNFYGVFMLYGGEDECQKGHYT